MKMDSEPIPRSKRIYLTHRTLNPHAFTETNDIASIIRPAIQYNIGSLPDDTEVHGTLFIGTKRYAASDAYKVLYQIMIIAVKHREGGSLSKLIHDDLASNQDVDTEAKALEAQSDIVCEQLGIDQKDVVDCLEAFDVVFARHQLSKPQQERDHKFLRGYLTRIRNSSHV